MLIPISENARHIEYKMPIPEVVYDNCDVDVEMDSLCSGLGIKREWLETVIYIESRWNPKAVNKYSGAVGLLQFMPRTLRWMGFTRKEVLSMSAVDQLALVDIYLRRSMYVFGKPYRASDLYLLIFYPREIYASPSKTIFPFCSIGYHQNKGLDFNKDGEITRGDIDKYVRQSNDKRKNNSGA